MKAIRAFIAVDLAPEILDHIDNISMQLKSRLSDIPIRWVPSDNIHLTLKFLGDVSTSNLDMLNKIIITEAEKQSPFELSVGELGAFPSIPRPRVIWIGIEAPSELSILQKGIENETARMGYARERRPFSAHLTIGRVSRNANANQVRQIGDVLANCKVGFIGATRVDAVYLYRSDLRPAGAVYTKLYTAPFQNSE